MRKANSTLRITLFLGLIVFVWFQVMGCTTPDNDEGETTEFTDLQVGPETDPAQLVPAFYQTNPHYWGTVTNHEVTASFWAMGFSQTELYASIHDSDTLVHRSLLYLDNPCISLLITTQDQYFLLYYAEFLDGENDSYHQLNLYRMVVDKTLKVLENEKISSFTRAALIQFDFEIQRTSIRIAPTMKWLGQCFLLIWVEENEGTYEMWGLTLDQGGEALSPDPFFIIEIPMEQYHVPSYSLTTNGHYSLLTWLESTTQDAAARNVKGLVFDEFGTIQSNVLFLTTSEDTITKLTSATDNQSHLVIWQSQGVEFGMRVSFEGTLLEPGVFQIETDNTTSHPDLDPILCPRDGNDGFAVVFKSGTKIKISVLAGDASLENNFIITDAHLIHDLNMIIPEQDHYRILWSTKESINYLYEYVYQFKTVTVQENGVRTKESTCCVPANQTLDPALTSSDNVVALIWTDDRDMAPNKSDVYGYLLNMAERNSSSADFPLFDSGLRERDSQIVSNGSSFVVAIKSLYKYNHSRIDYFSYAFFDEQFDLLWIENLEAPDPSYAQGAWSIASNGERYLIVYQTETALVGRWIYSDGTQDGNTVSILEGNGELPPLKYVVTAAAGGNFLVTYEQNESLLAKIVSDQGTISEPIELIPQPITGLGVINISGTADIFFVTWIDLNHSSPPALVGKRITSDGIILDQQAFPIHSQNQHEAIRNPVQSFNGDYFLVAWRVEQKEGEESDYAIWGKRVFEDGTIIDSESCLVFPAETKFDSSLTVKGLSETSGGSFWLTYTRSLEPTNIYLPINRTMTRIIQ